MSKSRKKSQGKPATPNFSPLTLLRPRLDALLGDASLADKDALELQGSLDALLQALPADDFLPILLRAVQSAPAAAQTRLHEVIPAWLCARGHLNALRQMVQVQRLIPTSQACALAWLHAAGIDTAAVQPAPVLPSFYAAYTYRDDSQGLLNIFWYADNRCRRVQGMSFLLDFNPPWDGAVKDIIICEPRAPEHIKQRYVDCWDGRGMPLRSLSAAEAKRQLLQCLAVNQRQGIRLPYELVTNRRLFVEHVLSLPDTPDTPPFSAEDFDHLNRTGQTAESLRHFEQHVGRRVRLQDGQEILVLGKPHEDDW